MTLLERSLFSGAAMNAFGEEPLLVDNPLWVGKLLVVGEGGSGSGSVEVDLVVIMPHISATPASMGEIVALDRENLLAFTSRQRL